MRTPVVARKSRPRITGKARWRSSITCTSAGHCLPCQSRQIVFFPRAWCVVPSAMTNLCLSAGRKFSSAAVTCRHRLCFINVKVLPVSTTASPCMPLMVMGTNSRPCWSLSLCVWCWTTVNSASPCLLLLSDVFFSCLSELACTFCQYSLAPEQSFSTIEPTFTSCATVVTVPRRHPAILGLLLFKIRLTISSSGMSCFHFRHKSW